MAAFSAELQDGMHILARLFEKTPGLVLFAPERDENGAEYIAVVVREITPELTRQLPPRVRGVRIVVRDTLTAR
jgi:hypothetical protein